MANFKTKSAVAAGHQPALTPSGPEMATGRFGQPIAVVDHVAGTRGVIGVLPAGCLPSMAFVRTEALGAGFKASVGVLDPSTGAISTKAIDGGGAWVVDDTTGAAGGYKQLTPAPFGKVQPSDEDRQLVLEITGAGTAAGLFGFDLVYFNA